MKRIVTMVCILMVSVWIGNLPLPAEARHGQAKPKRHDCQAYGKVKWTSWRDYAYLYFKNRTQSDIIVSYIDWAGKKRQWSRQPIKPGKGFYTGTFLTLPWIVETTKGDCLGIWEATKANRVGWVTIIKPESAGIRHACAKQAQLKFKYQWDWLRLEFTNKTSKEHSLYIVWQGKRWPAKRPFAKIPPGATYKQPTYPTLPWMVVDDKDQCVGIWEADALVSRVTLKPKAGGPPKPPLLDGVPLGYLHYKEQAVLTAGQAFPTIPPTPDGGLVYLGICVASNAQRSVPPEVLLPDTDGIKQGWGQKQVYRGPQHGRIQGTATGISGHVIAVRQGGDFDCGPMEKDWGRYVSQKAKKSIVPGTSKKLTLVVDVDSDRAGKRQLDITKQAHAGDMNKNHPAFKDWTLYQAKKGTHTPYEIIDFSDDFKDPNNAGRKRLPAVAKPGSDGTANAYVSCAQTFFNPGKPQAGCGIGIVVKAVNSYEAYHYDHQAKEKVPVRGLGYLPKDGQIRPALIKGRNLNRAFADRPDDPANQIKDGFRIHAIYVLPQDFKDYRLDLPDSKNGGIPQALKYANEVVKKQAGKNQHQFRLDVIKGTDVPDVSFLRLGLTDKEVFTGKNSPFSGTQDKKQTQWFNILAQAVNAAGFNHPRKMYAVFYPGNSDVGGVASNANVGITTWVHGSKAPQDVMSPWGARVYLHELFHNLGQVVNCGPDDDGGAHSKIKGDVMKDAGTNIDVARTTYYDHNNSCTLDLAKSIFLTPAPKPVAQLPPSWKLNQHCIYRNLWAGNGKVCSKMTASDYNASGAGGGSGLGASTQSSGGQINAAQAGIKEVDEAGIDWHNHTSYWDKKSSGISTKGTGTGASKSRASGAGQFSDEELPM